MSLETTWTYSFTTYSRLINDTQYNVVFVDTEYPGQAGRRRKPEAFYSIMKTTKNDFKLTRVGLTISDAEGNLPDFGTDYRVMWEFKLCNLDNQDYESITNSRRSCGIRLQDFSTKMVISGLIGRTDNRLTWITFEGAYNFQFMIKILTKKELPEDLQEFHSLVQQQFGNNVFDVKHVIDPLGCGRIFGDLYDVSSQLDIVREISLWHKASSNSLVTSQVYQKLRDLYLEEDIMHR